MSLIFTFNGLLVTAVIWLIQRQRWTLAKRLVLSLILTILLGLSLYLINNKAFLGGGGWYEKSPFREAILFLVMLCGMSARYVTKAIEDRREKLKQLNGSDQYGKPKLEFDVWEFSYPLFFSVVTFGSLLGQIKDDNLTFTTIVLSFQTGFFWQTLLKKEISSTQLLPKQVENVHQYQSFPQGKNEESEPTKVIKILFLASNPKNTSQLRLDEEMRGIDQALRQAEFRDRFDIRQHWAVRVVDLQGYLLRHKPDIVHFSGHGSRSSEIILEDEDGNSQAVSGLALSQLFSVLKDNIRCVILNACYSQEQAQAVAKHIDCVVGMSKAIGDAAAINFAIAFYQALGYGRDVKTAFDLGCGLINLQGIKEQDTPKLLASKGKPEQVVFV